MSPTFLAFIKEYWDEIALAACIVALIVLATVKTIEVYSLKVDLAEEKRQHSEMIASHERVARELAETRGKIQSAHAAGQQQKEKEYEEERQRQADARAADRRELDRLRVAIKAYAAGGRTSGGTDAAAGVGQDDRLDRLASLLDEGVELVVEGRGVVERRDSEVKRLLDQIALDRAACSTQKD